MSELKFPCKAMLRGSMGSVVTVYLESEDDLYYYGKCDTTTETRFLKRKGKDGEARVGYAIGHIISEKESEDKS